MGLMGYLRKGIEIAKLNRDAVSEVAADGGAFIYAVIFFGIGGLAAGLGGLMVRPAFGLLMVIGGPVLHIATSFIWVGLLYIVARMFGGKGGYLEYYTALGVGSVPVWAQVIPMVGWLIAMWNLPVSVIVTERVHGLSTGRSVAVVLFPLIITILFVFLVMVALGAVFTGILATVGQDFLRHPH